VVPRRIVTPHGVRLGTDDRRARLRGRDGSGCVPAAERQHGIEQPAPVRRRAGQLDAPTASGRDHGGGRLEAQGCGIRPLERRKASGRGFAWFYDDAEGTNAQAAAIADVEVDTKTGKIAVKHIYGGVSSGFIVSPGLVENQIVGAMVYITSRVLREELWFDKRHVTSFDWITYPILRFVDAPSVTPVVVQRPDLQPLGAGEPVSMAAAAAIANAFFDATGVRLRRAPFTPARVRATLAAAAKG
jgi:CO/xanthine dehydrogenase Mo-binding subunit